MTYGTAESQAAQMSASSLDEFMSCKLAEEKYEMLVRMGGVADLAKRLGSDINDGLSEEEKNRDAFAARATQYGRNVYPSRRIPSIFEMWWDAFKDEMIIILTIAAFISMIVSLIFPPENEPRALAWIDGGAILMAVVIVTCVAAVNNYSQEKQFQVLSQKQDERAIRVIRGGKKSEIMLNELLVGDIISLEQGDPVPTDGIFVSGHSCACDESNMTGESEPQTKNTKKCFMLSGCRVVHGSCIMLATAVGMNSQWGKVLSEMDVEREDTPLQEKLAEFAKYIGFLGVGVAILVFGVLLLYWFYDIYVIAASPSLHWRWANLIDILKFFIMSITIIVVAVPEGLPLAVTIALAYSTKKMMKDNNLVRHLAACETMGGVTQICSDKTGTLTMNRMTVTTGWVAGANFQDMPVGLSPQVVDILTQAIARNSTGDLMAPETPGGKIGYSGNPTECSLLCWINRFPGIDYDRIRREGPAVVKVFPFSSQRKRMSVVIKTDNGYRMFCKGASEIILGKCTSQLTTNTSLAPLTTEQKQDLMKKIEEMASNGLRTLAITYRDFPSFDVSDEIVDGEDEAPEDNLVLIALCGIEDPVRPEVPGAVQQCIRAGVTVRMVTGDNILTAKNIAKQCGILTSDGIALEGPKFSEMSDEELYKILPRIQVLARSQPSDKTRLVRALRHFNELVAVTGDGTNDGPALKAAHIGCAMGSGTQVAIEASDIVILDDNFYSIVKAIMWGRSIFDNIRKFLQFQLTVNVGALVVAFLCALLNLGTPLQAIQLLWVNLIMDSLGALALATEPPHPKLLERPPINAAHPKTWLVNPNMMKNIAGQAFYQVLVLMAGIYLIPYIPNLSWDKRLHEWTHVIMKSEEHYTIIFNAFVYCQIFNEINARKVDGTLNVFEGIHTNWLFIVIIVLEGVCQALIVEIPGFNEVFHCVHLNWREWLLCIGVGVVSLPIGLFLNLLTPLFPQDKPLTNDDFQGEDLLEEEDLGEKTPLLSSKH